VLWRLTTGKAVAKRYRDGLSDTAELVVIAQGDQVRKGNEHSPRQSDPMGLSEGGPMRARGRLDGYDEVMATTRRNTPIPPCRRTRA
jgi:hypothetical protein